MTLRHGLWGLLGLAGTALLLLCVVAALVWFEPPQVSVLYAQFWAAVPPATAGLPLVQLWVKFGLYMLAHYWVLWLVPLLGLSVTTLLLLRGDMDDRDVYLARIYTQEKQLDQAMSYAKQAEQWLERSQAALDKLYEQAPEGYVVLDENGRMQRWNSAHLDLMRRVGVVSDDLSGRTLVDVWPGLVDTTLHEPLTAPRRERSFAGVVRVSQARLHLEARLFAQNDGCVLLLRDVSYQYRPEVNKDLTEALLRQLVEESVRPIAVLDMEGKYRLVSRRWHETLGIESQRNLIGLPHAAVMPGFPNNFGVLLHQLEAGQVLAKEEERVMLHGEERILGWHIRLWRDAFGEAAGYIFAAYDNTEMVRLRAQVKEAGEREHALAYTDGLTGLPNRVLFSDRLNMAVAQAHRQLGRVAVIFLDLDGFKKVNDTLGHEAGDMLLKQVAGRLRDLTRDTDTVARLGGDEFVMILPVRGREDAELVGNKILDTIRKPYDLSGVPAHVGTSIGMALYPLDAQASSELVKLADGAMYAAKQAGKNNWKWAKQEPGS